MKLRELEGKDRAFNGICHDCNKPVEVSVIVNDEGEINISGGAVYKIKQGLLEERLYFKCDECFAKDHTLHDFRRCEVYSRVVGYLRPVQQWNKGKLAEFELRKEFKNTM